MATSKTKSEKEIWKSPPSLNKRWVEVSNLGRVRTLDHEIEFVRLGKKQTRFSIGRIRQGLICDSRGRTQVPITSSDGLEQPFLHRLVAECFVPNPHPDEYDMVFFKDGNAKNCRASNLEWGSGREKFIMTRGNLAIYKIFVISNGKKIGEYIGCGEVARALGCSKQTVHSSLMKGHRCMGFQLVATKCEGEKPFHSIEEARKVAKSIPKDLDIPDSLYSQVRLDITPKAVFRALQDTKIPLDAK